jgi:hypothetical protein
MTSCRNITSQLLVVCALVILGHLSSSAQKADPTGIDIHFKVPKGWKKQGDGVFALANLKKSYDIWSQALANGHMPWRLDPRNVAVTCLWDFGITDSAKSGVFRFADRLNELQKDEIYSLKVQSATYIVSIRSKLYRGHYIDGNGERQIQSLSIPIACKLQVIHDHETGGKKE